MDRLFRRHGIDWPLVLHVRSTPLATAYDHWVTLVRVDGDPAVVADVTGIAAGFARVGPTLVRTSSGGSDGDKGNVIVRMPLSRLLAHCDGVAVAVAARLLGFAVGLVFVYAGLSELRQPADSLRDVYAYELAGPPLGRYLAMCLPHLEIVAAAAGGCAAAARPRIGR